MALYTIPQRIKHRRGTYTELYQRNEILLEGEECFVTHDADGLPLDPQPSKVGDGSTPWNDLEYQSEASGASTSSSGQVPTLIGSGETFTVSENKQVLFHRRIKVDGRLVIDGTLIRV